MHFEDVMNTIVRAFEALGVAILVVGTVIAFVRYLLNLRQDTDRTAAFVALRSQLGRSILLGLEVLVAADIVRTIVEVPSLQSAISLGIIVLVQTQGVLTMLAQLGNPPDLVGKVNTGKVCAIIGLVVSALALVGGIGAQVVGALNRG